MLIPGIKTEEKVKRDRVPGKYLETNQTVGPFFLDSGAFSLYYRSKEVKTLQDRLQYDYSYYESDEYWAYVDAYAKFVKDNEDAMDYYANVDVLYNPELTWKTQKCLEDEYGLSPVPVIHLRTDLKWLHKYLKAGYDYIGLGGASRGGARPWFDQVFDGLCPKPKRLPVVKTHGFATTSYPNMVRYPWFSVDSASWVKAGAYGRIYVPHKRNGKYVFDVSPYCMAVSSESPMLKKKGQHILTLGSGEKGKAYSIVAEWLDLIGVPMGKVGPKNEIIEWGVSSHDKPRYMANLRFFEALCKWLPEYPCPFKYYPKDTLL